MTSRTLRRIAAIAALAAIVAALVGLGRYVVGSGRLSAATRLPELAYRDARGSHVIRADGRERTLIVLYHSKCGHCGYQLDAMEKRSPELAHARVYFLTTETGVDPAELQRRWPSLVRSPSMAWGTVSADEFRSHLRTLATPALFLFDEKGRLVVQYVGETKLDLLLPVLAGSAD
jgi:hypothetical protein